MTKRSTRRSTRRTWQWTTRLLEWEAQHELMADMVTALFMVIVLGCLLFLALNHDALWYGGLSEAELFAASGY